MSYKIKGVELKKALATHKILSDDSLVSIAIADGGVKKKLVLVPCAIESNPRKVEGTYFCYFGGGCALVTSAKNSDSPGPESPRDPCPCLT